MMSIFQDATRSTAPMWSRRRAHQCLEMQVDAITPPTERANA